MFPGVFTLVSRPPQSNTTTLKGMNAQCSKETTFKLFEPCEGVAKETFEIPEGFAASLSPRS